MIKIDWQLFFKNYMVFGVYYIGSPGIFPTSQPIGKTGYYYTKWWTLRCWPILREDKVVPDWYMAIWDFFGYAKDDKDND